jgi:hypothetical protein
VLECLKLAELKAACKSLELDERGRTKEDLLERILASGSAAETPLPMSVAPMRDARLNRVRVSSTPPPMSVHSTGLLKSALRHFVLDLAGGHRGRGAAPEFAVGLLRSFGWANDGLPDDVQLFPSLDIAMDGQRATRNVALLWNSRRVLIETHIKGGRKHRAEPVRRGHLRGPRNYGHVSQNSRE